MTYNSSAPVVFSGTLQPFGTSEIAVNIPAQTVLASAQIAWGSLTSTNDLGLSLRDPQGRELNSAADELNLPGLTGKREREVVTWPQSGAWRVKVYNQTSPNITAQPFRGVLQTMQVAYSPLSDVNSLDAATRADIYQSLRYFVMPAYGPRFGPAWPVSRADLASALVLAGRVPQYVGASPWFPDVTNSTTRNFVESAQAGSNGALFYDAARGSNFRPEASVTRLTAAVALVRAAGWESEVNNTSLTTGDLTLVSLGWRGHAAVALAHGLLSPQGLNFNPNNALTRAELAHAMTQLMAANAN